MRLGALAARAVAEQLQRATTCPTCGKPTLAVNVADYRQSFRADAHVVYCTCTPERAA